MLLQGSPVGCLVGAAAALFALADILRCPARRSADVRGLRERFVLRGQQLLLEHDQNAVGHTLNLMLVNWPIMDLLERLEARWKQEPITAPLVVS